jgi:hypothetical protein
MTTATKTRSTTVHEWNNVDWSYPSCGGTIGSVDASGVAIIEHLSNIQGQGTGSVSRWQLNQDAVDAIKGDKLDDDYNECNTWGQMIESHIEYIATLLPGGKRGHIVR